MRMRLFVLWYFAPCFLAGVINASYDITGITNGTFSQLLGFPLSVYNLGSALFPQIDNSDYTNYFIYDDYDEGHIYLFTDACQQTDGTHNCSASCSNLTMMFENLETLHNCMVYPAVAFQYANNDLSGPATEIAQNLGIAKNHTNSSTSIITKSIQSCLTVYCSDDVAKGCPGLFDSDVPEDNPYGNSPSYDFSFQGSSLVDAICEYSLYPVNSDIGGIGVYLNYNLA